MLVRRDAIVVPDGSHSVIEEPLALEPKVLEKLSEPKKKPTVMDFVRYWGGKAIVDEAAAFEAFEKDHLNSGQFSALSSLSKAQISIESLHVRCAFAAGEIANAGKHALQDSFDGNSTFDEIIQAIGGPYGAEKPVR